MLVIGLTGGIATGKSTVSQYLRELGAVIIDADDLARELVLPNSPAWKEIVNCFGKEIVAEDGFLNRKKLGGIIFQSPFKREILNKIMHPRIKEKTVELIKYYRQSEDIAFVVVDAPLLIEAGMTDMVDEIWVVTMPEELQYRRLRERDNLSMEEVQKRINSQLSLAEKLKYANRVIDNSGEREETKKIVYSLWKSVNESVTAGRKC